MRLRGLTVIHRLQRLREIFVCQMAGNVAIKNNNSRITSQNLKIQSFYTNNFNDVEESKTDNQRIFLLFVGALLSFTVDFTISAP